MTKPGRAGCSGTLRPVPQGGVLSHAHASSRCRRARAGGRARLGLRGRGDLDTRPVAQSGREPSGGEPGGEPEPGRQPQPALAVAERLRLGEPATLAAGKLTIGTDNPAYPPYFEPPATGNAPKPWELGDPTNGKGFESAVAYAVADKLGFAKDQVDLDRRAVRQLVRARHEDVRLRHQPGLVHARARDRPSTVATATTSSTRRSSPSRATPIAKVTTIAGLKAFKLGAQVGTTSYDTIKNVIKPTTEPSGLRHQRRRRRGAQEQADRRPRRRPADRLLRHGGPDRRREGQRARSIVGQFPRQAGPDAEHFSLVLAKGSPLTRLREPGDRGAEGGRHARPDHAGRGWRTRRAPRSSSPDADRRCR